MMAADERDTVLMFRALHNTARVFRNDVAIEVEEIEKEKGQEIQFPDVAHLVMGDRGRKAEEAGDADGGIWTAGQVIGLIDSCPSCQEVMEEMMAECEATIRGRLAHMLTAKL